MTAKACKKPDTSIHCADLGRKPCDNMLEHLIEYEPPLHYVDAPEALASVPPVDILDAQVSTADWLEQMGAPTLNAAAQSAAQSAAQNAFASLVKDSPPPAQRQALIALKTPQAVRHLTGMLTAYDWEFVEQAKELRGYAVSQLLEETKHPDAKIRLRALELLGRVTEVALFTDRVEVKKTSVTDAELDAKIKEKLARFAGVVDIPSEVTDVAVSTPDES